MHWKGDAGRAVTPFPVNHKQSPPHKVSHNPLVCITSFPEVVVTLGTEHTTLGKQKVLVRRRMVLQPGTLRRDEAAQRCYCPCVSPLAPYGSARGQWDSTGGVQLRRGWPLSLLILEQSLQVQVWHERNRQHMLDSWAPRTYLPQWCVEGPGRAGLLSPWTRKPHR